MRIPERVREQLGGGGWAHGGTRSKDCTPAGHVVWGLRVTADHEHVEVFIPKVFASGLTENQADNRAFALTFNSSGTNTCVQLKGKSVDVRSPNEEERAYQKTWGARNVEYFAKLAGEAMRGALGPFTELESIYLRFKVEEIFDQTPGPNAGKRVTEEV